MNVPRNRMSLCAPVFQVEGKCLQWRNLNKMLITTSLLLLQLFRRAFTQVTERKCVKSCSEDVSSIHSMKCKEQQCKANAVHCSKHCQKIDATRGKMSTFLVSLGDIAPLCPLKALFTFAYCHWAMSGNRSTELYTALLLSASLLSRLSASKVLWLFLQQIHKHLKKMNRLEV